MYRREFESLIKKNLPRAVLLYGENNYLISLYIEFYIKKTKSLDTLRRYYFDEYDFSSSKSYLSQISLFGGINLLIIKRDKKIPKRELDTLIELVSKSSDNYLIFYFQGKAKDAKSMQSSFSSKKGAIWVRLFAPNIVESIELLNKRAKNIGLNIDNSSLQHLLLLLDGNLSLSANELDKLSIIEDKITTKDIDRLVYSTSPLSIDKLITQIFHKKPITKILNQIDRLGVDEFATLRATEIFVNQIYLFHIHIKLYGNSNSQDIIGYRLPRDIEEQKAKIARELNLNTILKIFNLLLEVELKMKKSSPHNRELLLYGAFIRFQSIL